MAVSLSTSRIGAHYEALALRYLSHQGLTLIEKNFRTKLGEIDLIMLHEDILVFVEVRYRRNGHQLHPADTITYPKQRKIHRTAQYFLTRHRKWRETPYRFDIVGIMQQNGGPKVHWLSDAF